MKDILLFDRIKEKTHITGASDILLEGASAGFSAFSEYMSSGDHVFYAITDGIQYEVGSGQFIGQHVAGTTTLLRDAVRTSNSDNSKVSFAAGIKEVYATYPGAFAVISNPLDEPQATRESGVAYWSGPQTLDSTSEFVWNEASGRLGINTSQPSVALEIGGNNIDSEIKVSGITLGVSGVNFATVGVGFFSGRQKEPFIRNNLSENTSGILNLSGSVDQTISFNNQVAGTFLGVASGECPDGCVNAHPQFRTLQQADIPDLSGLYLTQDQHSENSSGNVAFVKRDKLLTYADTFRFDTTKSPNELIVSGIIRFPDADNSTITGGYIAGTGLELSQNRTFNMGGSGQLDRLETRFTDANNSQLVSNSGSYNNPYTENVIVNHSGFLTVPVFNQVSDVVSRIPAGNVGAIAFASGDSYIMIANGASWVSGQLI